MFFWKNGRDQVLDQGAVSLSHTGDLLESTLNTVIVPANTLGPNGQLEIVSLWSMTNNVNSKTPRIKLNGTWVWGLAATSTGSMQIYSRMANRGNAASQVSFPASQLGLGALSGANPALAFDTTADLTITFTGQLAVGTDAIALESYLIKVYPKG